VLQLRSATGAGDCTGSTQTTVLSSQEIGRKRRVPPKIKAIGTPVGPHRWRYKAVAIWAQHGDGCPEVPEGALAPCANVNFWLIATTPGDCRCIRTTAMTEDADGRGTLIRSSSQLPPRDGPLDYVGHAVSTG
jgi:hypothetical protein